MSPLLDFALLQLADIDQRGLAIFLGFKPASAAETFKLVTLCTRMPKDSNATKLQILPHAGCSAGQSIPHNPGGFLMPHAIASVQAKADEEQTGEEVKDTSVKAASAEEPTEMEVDTDEPADGVPQSAIDTATEKVQPLSCSLIQNGLMFNKDVCCSPD